MMTFRNSLLQELRLPADTVRLMIEIAELKGRQQFYEKQKPQLLRALRAAASVRSVESSNRIAGITVEPDRLPVLTAGRHEPRNRAEELIRGYAHALTLVYVEASVAQVSPDFVRRLHRVALGGENDSGQWKSEVNASFDVCEGEPWSPGFQSVSVREIPMAMEELCMLYRAELHAQKVHSLMAVAAFIFDFLCIQPFRVGNGRISRLLALATLYHQGFEVGRFISLERFFEHSRAEYAEALRGSFDGWREGKHNPLPWLNYFFTVLRRGSLEFNQRALEKTSARGTKMPLVEVAIDSLPYEFTFAELERTCPGVSDETVRRVLRRLRKNGSLVCVYRSEGVVAWRKADDLLVALRRSRSSDLARTDVP